MSCARDWVIITGSNGSERFAWCRCCGVLREAVFDDPSGKRKSRYHVPRNEKLNRRMVRSGAGAKL